MYAVAIAGVIAVSAAGWAPREHVKLTSGWEMVTAPAGQKTPPKSGWKAVDLPATFNSVRGGQGWFRRRLAVPDEWNGKRVKLVLQGAKYCPEVFVNGKPCGRHFGGYEPAVFDITDALGTASEAEILIHVYDWTALFKGPPVKIPPDIDWLALRGVPRDRIVYPIGGRYSECGLWDDVVVYAVPPVYIADAFIITDVGKRKLTVRYQIADETEAGMRVEISARVMRGGKEVMRLGKKALTVQDESTARITLTGTWEDGHVELWSPEQPRLYVLETVVRTPDWRDVRHDRFGFRQLTIKGPNFYLNGVKRHLLATSAWPMAARTREEIARVLRAFKSANCICFRTHTQPWRQIWYDVADEVGILMIPEGAVWNDDEVYRLDDPEFWRNWGEHLRGMVRALRNHPSVVMWSLENEFHGRRARSGTVYEKRLADLGRLVKREDPTRPITYESDGDPGGVADVIGLHYPHEAPEHRLWPQEAYWMDKTGTQGVGMFWPTKEFRWDRRKPLYIGEFGWMPGGEPGRYALISGDEGYRDLGWARSNAKAAVWRWQIVAYRHYGVSGICPWTMVEGGPLDPGKNMVMAAQAWAMQHVAAYVREELWRAYGGSTVVRHLEIFNDEPRPLQGTLRWALIADGRTLAEGGMGLHMAPADHWDRELKFTAPGVRRAVVATLRIWIETGGRRLFADEHPFTIYPRPRLKAPGAALYLYDPRGETAELLRAQGIAPRKVASLTDLPDEPAVLVIGERALSDDMSQLEAYEGAQAVAEFVRRGGAAVVLQQTSPAAGVLPGGLVPGARSTMGFIINHAHPLTAGLPEDAFKFWAPDHTISHAEMARLPGGTVALVAVGTGRGLSRCVLAEARRGAGTWLRCQLPVVERFAEEPMACGLLQRMLDYAARVVRERQRARAVAVVGGDENYRSLLAALGLRVEGGELSAQALRSGRIVLVRGKARVNGSPQEIAAALADGGTLVLDRPALPVVRALGGALGIELTVEPYAGPTLRSEGQGELVQAIAREDLYWLGQRKTGPWWASQPLAGDVAEGCIGIGGKFEPLVKLGPADMELSGHIVERREDHIVMATVGAATGKFSVPRDGAYLVAVEARGTKCQGTYAMALVSVDDQPVGAVATVDRWRWRLLPTRLSAGEHEVTVRFINDMNTPTEDRNLFLRAVAVAPAGKRLGRLEQIALGMTCVALPVGKGRVVINFLKWDDPGPRNAEKAARFWCSLLAALGADFADDIALAYSVAQQFRPDPQMPNYSVRGEVAMLASAGGVEGEIEVPRDGTYELLVEASGTRAAGELPVVAVAVDGRRVGVVKLAQENWRLYPVRVELTAGRHRVRLEFTNDYYAPPEDRNLALRRLLVRTAGGGKQ